MSDTTPGTYVSGDGVLEQGEEIVGDGGGGADQTVGHAGVDHLSAGHGADGEATASLDVTHQYRAAFTDALARITE